MNKHNVVELEGREILSRSIDRDVERWRHAVD